MVHLTFTLPLVAVFLMCTVALTHAGWSFTPRLYLQEQYDDNIFLTETNEEDDFVTTISPGINLAHETPTQQIKLDYEIQKFLYDDFSELDYTGHRGHGEARKDFGPRFSAGITERFINSEDPIELTGRAIFERPSIRSGERNPYTRNIVEPEMTFRFGEKRSIRLGYRNHILRNEREDIADQDEDTANALLSYRYNIHNGLEFSYEYIDHEYGATTPAETPRDFDGNEIRGRYTYYFDPRTAAFAEYRYYETNFDQESTRFFDYEIHNPRLGFSRDLYENLSFNASIGYVFRKAEDRDDEQAFSGRLDFSGRLNRLFGDVYAESGFDEDLLSAENLGFNQFRRAGVNSGYQLLERLWARAFFYVEEDTFVDLDRKDTLWNLRGSLTYQPLKWLYLSFDYERNERDSNIAFQSYVDNRYLGRLTVEYDVAELFP